MGKSLTGNELGKGFVQRKDGRYEARATVNGVKIDIIDKDLINLKEKFNEAYLKAQLSATATSNCKLSEWFTEWIEKCKKPQLKSETSYKVYRRKVENTFIPLMGQKSISAITQLDIQTAVNTLQEKEYVERSIREALGILRECFDVAIANHMATFNPCVCIAIKNNNVVMSERRVLDKWEQDLMLEIVEGQYYEIPYKILLCTGMRAGEFAGLQWGDIDFEKKCINIQRSMKTEYDGGKKIMKMTTPKTQNSYRSIPFFGETEQLLKRWKKMQDAYKEDLGGRWRADPEFGDLVFTTSLGSPINRYNLAHNINKTHNDMIIHERLSAIKENRMERVIKHIHPHAFRHTFCTRCFEKGMDPVIVQRIMGHSHYSTTLTYTHILDQKQREEVEKVGNFLN